MNQRSLKIVSLSCWGLRLMVDVHDIYVDNQHIILSLWDTAGQEEFDRLRTLSYADTHVIMLCFSVESRDSLENVQEKWWDEIARHCEGILPPAPSNPSFCFLPVPLSLGFFGHLFG